MRSRTIVLCGLIGLATCTRPDPAADPARSPAGDATDQGLAASLAAQVEADTVRFGLHVTNVSGDTLTLEFVTGQRFDFAVRSAAGEEVWRWSADQMFGQALGTERVGPGETVSYTAAWGAGERRGAHTAIGVLTSSNKPIELRTDFEIAGR